MNWLSWPSIIVSSIAFIKIVFIDNPLVERESNKDKFSKFLESLLWSLILFALFSLIFALIGVVKYSPTGEFRIWIFFSVFLSSALIISFYFSKMINKLGKVTNTDGKYHVKKCEKYQFRYEVTESYTTESKIENKKIQFVSLAYKLSIFLSIALIFLTMQNGYRAMTSSYDIDSPLVANEKIYLSSNKEIKDQLVDGAGNPVALPAGTVFSIRKGEKFDIENKKQAKSITNEFYIPDYDGKWGIGLNQKIVLKKGSRLFFEQVYDRNLYRNDSKYHYTIKTIPGKSSLVLSNQMSFSVHPSVESPEKDYYEFVIGKSAKEQLEDIYLAALIILSFVLWGVAWTVAGINSIRGVVYTVCVEMGIVILIILSILSQDYYISFIIAIVIVAALILLLYRSFGKFCDSYRFIKKFGESKSISFEPLMDKSEFDLYFEDQERSMDFVIDEIQGTKEILKLYDQAGEEKDSIQIFWYSNRWEIFTEFLKELKQKTVNFFRKFRRS